jgi:hypothetical protein
MMRDSPSLVLLPRDQWLIAGEENKMRAIAKSALVAIGLSVVVAAPAVAATKGPQSTDVSCDAVTVKLGVSVSHGSTGRFKITQNAATEGSSTRAWARSSNGNDLNSKVISTGETAVWDSVLPSTYTTRFLRSSSANCNGILPGNGNYTLNYTVTYQR